MIVIILIDVCYSILNQKWAALRKKVPNGLSCGSRGRAYPYFGMTPTQAIGYLFV